jgi:hypothetical protein
MVLLQDKGKRSVGRKMQGQTDTVTGHITQRDRIMSRVAIILSQNACEKSSIFTIHSILRLLPKSQVITKQ